MHRHASFILALLALLALLSPVASACEVGIDPRAFTKPATAYPDGPLPIVRSGTNAPEMLMHVYFAGAISGGVQRARAYWGPCRRQAFGRTILTIRTHAPVRPGDLYFVVGQDRVTPAGLIPIGVGWALRRATSNEERDYQTCRWT